MNKQCRMKGFALDTERKAAWFLATTLSSLLLMSFALSEGRRENPTDGHTLFGTVPGALLGGASFLEWDMA